MSSMPLEISELKSVPAKNNIPRPSKPKNKSKGKKLSVSQLMLNYLHVHKKHQGLIIL